VRAENCSAHREDMFLGSEKDDGYNVVISDAYINGFADVKTENYFEGGKHEVEKGTIR